MQKLGELQEAVTRARSETIEKETQAAQLAAIEALKQATRHATRYRVECLHSGSEKRADRLAAEIGANSEKLGDRHPEIIKLRSAVDNAERKLHQNCRRRGRLDSERS